MKSGKRAFIIIFIFATFFASISLAQQQQAEQPQQVVQPEQQPVQIEQPQQIVQPQQQNEEQMLPPPTIDDQEPLTEEPRTPSAVQPRQGALTVPGGDAIPEEEGMEGEIPDATEEITQEETEISRQVTIDGVVNLDYVFHEGESFLISYNFHIEGAANARVSIIKGDAEIKTKVDGLLAKWPTGECKLEVTIPKVPFELTFRRTDQENASLNLRFQGAIQENWASRCSFRDKPGAGFNTSGPPEKWLVKALAKTSPSLTSLVSKLNPEEETSSTFTIRQFTLEDEPLGSAQIEGQGVITIRPK